VICGDALALPVRNAAVDAVVLAFVLFHLADPIQAIAEAARVLAGGGRIGTATWAQDELTKADAVWDETLTEVGAPPLPARRVDAGLDSPDAIHRLLTDVGLSPTRIWFHPLSQLWEPAAHYRFATGSGRSKQRLQQLDAATRSKALRRARKRLRELDPSAFAWHGEVVCAVATLPGESRTTNRAPAHIASASPGREGPLTP
jgi:SAM-dependent methyltransferase